MSSLFFFFFFFFSLRFCPFLLMVDHLRECASISSQKKKGFSLRDLTKLYRSLFALRSWRHHKKSFSKEPHSKRPQTIEEPYQGPGNENRDKGNMYEVGSYRYNGDGLRGDSPTNSNKACFKHRSMDTFFSSIPPPISRSASKRSPGPSPRPSFAYWNGSLRSTDTKGIFPEAPSTSSSRWNGNPIMFSNSTGMMKPPPIERQLECTLEELCYGCVKKIKITRDVLTESGQIVQEDEILSVKVKPGWKKGTKITFEGMGNERPGAYAADITFVIAEKRHNLFTREGDDLELAIEIPLAKALTGCTIPIPLLGGEKMNLRVDEIIHPGYQRIITGQGMPSTKEQGSRGNLKVVFLINFPTELTDEQRATVVSILGDSC
ncbi:PREDICTED: dnaJ homolog subfamily B member 1 [Theobroma cacao]|uniref:DnaJ homolog subfamily B member 1 n=1 Tax=Theobroma cacao TaxID=3641 RepID=A0AB32WP11_THECC|nr:PREDICTED: dnaJ homolog subfamily B member 1 [Theobroma cacao]